MERKRILLVLRPGSATRSQQANVANRILLFSEIPKTAAGKVRWSLVAVKVLQI